MPRSRYRDGYMPPSPSGFPVPRCQFSASVAERIPSTDRSLAGICFVRVLLRGNAKPFHTLGEPSLTAAGERPPCRPHTRDASLQPPEHQPKDASVTESIPHRTRLARRKRRSLGSTPPTHRRRSRKTRLAFATYPILYISCRSEFHSRLFLTPIPDF